MRAAALYVPALLGGYLAATFTLWFAHWFSHRRGGPLTGFHVRGHHALYPSGAACLTDTFRYGVGWHDSVCAFLPWLGLLAGAIWWWLPASVAIVVTLEAVVIVGLWSYLHEKSSTSTARGCRPARGSFAPARHFRHHDGGVNFAVFDHLWDRLFRTFEA